MQNNEMDIFTEQNADIITERVHMQFAAKYAVWRVAATQDFRSVGQPEEGHSWWFVTSARA
jgi:hypothetical protein